VWLKPELFMPKRLASSVQPTQPLHRAQSPSITPRGEELPAPRWTPNTMAAPPAGANMGRRLSFSEHISADSAGSSLNSGSTATVSTRCTTESDSEKEKISGPCCGLTKRKKKKKQPKSFNQNIIVLRHSERLDHVDKRYKEAGVRVFDSPLSQRGLELAEEVAGELAELTAGQRFTGVVCSPYIRCIQTAAAVCKRLSIPIILDAEICEVWDEEMPSDRPPFRTPVELQALMAEIGLEAKNPLLPEGGLKLFGKNPKWPETIKDSHSRYLVRLGTYIEHSHTMHQNFILCSHAPAVVAALDIFQHGMVDIRGVDYCAYVSASRSIEYNLKEGTREVDAFLGVWDVKQSRCNAEIVDDPMREVDHEECVEAAATNSIKRRQQRTKTDKLFEDALKNIQVYESEE